MERIKERRAMPSNLRALVSRETGNMFLFSHLKPILNFVNFILVSGGFWIRELY